MELDRRGADTTISLHSPLSAASETQSANSAGAGIGLKYVRSRLQQSFPGRWQLSAEQSATHWITVIKVRDIDDLSEPALMSLPALS